MEEKIHVELESLWVRLFWLKTKFGNHFPENSMFGWHGKLGQTENIFNLTVK